MAALRPVRLMLALALALLAGRMQGRCWVCAPCLGMVEVPTALPRGGVALLQCPPMLVHSAAARCVAAQLQLVASVQLLQLSAGQRLEHSDTLHLCPVRETAVQTAHFNPRMNTVGLSRPWVGLCCTVD